MQFFSKNSSIFEIFESRWKIDFFSSIFWRIWPRWKQCKIIDFHGSETVKICTDRWETDLYESSPKTAPKNSRSALARLQAKKEVFLGVFSATFDFFRHSSGAVAIISLKLGFSLVFRTNNALARLSDAWSTTRHLIVL